MTLDIKTLLDHYGSIVLFAGLLLELIALPVPGEVLMSYCGLLIYQGKLGYVESVLLAWVGASVGITIAYAVGYFAGEPFFHKVGPKIHLGPERLEKTSQWFQKYGNKVLIVGYFIPGVRHITGYFSGITRIPFRVFALYAYIGSLLYTGIFISLGKVLGPKWEQYHQSMKKYLIIGGIIAAVLLIGYYLYRRYKMRILAFAAQVLDQALHRFHTLGRVRFLVAAAGAAFLGLFALMASMIQDFFAQEFAEFDRVTVYVVHALFSDRWEPVMNAFFQAASYRVLVPILAVSLLWVWRRGSDRVLEAAFLLVVLAGGELLDEGLRRLFHRLGPGGFAYTFPSEQALMVLTVYGFAAFLLIRHSGRAFVRTMTSLLVLGVALLSGISCIYFDVQYPSDVAAGFVFGGVWLSLCIILLEVFRLLRQEKGGGSRSR